MNRRIVVWALLVVLAHAAGAAFAEQREQADSPQQAHAHGTEAQAVDVATYPPELLAQLDALRAATERLRDHNVAVAEGYELVAGDGPLMGEHWVRRDLVDRPFDLTAPSTLQYLRVGDEYVLTGVAYTVYRAPEDPLPEGFVGDHDAWHVHDMIKISMTATAERPLLRWITERRIANGRTRWDASRPELTMVHAWVWLDNPDGVFAQEHRLIPYVRVGLPEGWGVSASFDAANGVALLGDDACGLAVRRVSFMAGAGRRQRRELSRACAMAEDRVRVALARAEESAARTEAVPGAFNAAAGAAWRGYVVRRWEILTTEQRARLAIGIEHPDAHGGHQNH